MRFLFLAALLVATPALAADVPGVLTHQGRLLDSSGVAVDGNHDITIALYEDDTTTTSVWSETVNVDVVGGFYAIVLGDASTVLGEADVDYDALYVGITVDSGTELAERQRLTSVPYALKSQRSDTATNVDGGVVNATEIQIDGTTVIDSSGAFVGSGGTGSGETLGGLTCGTDEIAQFDGLDWQCAPLSGAHTHDAIDIDSGTLVIDRLPVGTSSTDVAAGDHLHALSQLTGVLAQSQLPITFDTDAQAAMGAEGNGNAFNHARYTDGEAVGAMGTLGNSNALNHDRYTNNNARNAMGTEGDTNPLNHQRYDDTEAVAAMGGEGDTNPLNHQRYDDADAVGAMGAAADGNTLNHARYTDADAQAAVEGKWFWGKASIDDGTWRTSDGSSGNLGEPTTNGGEGCDSNTNPKVCIYRFSGTQHRIIFALPAANWGDEWFDASSTTLGAMCFATTAGDNESRPQEGFGRGAVSVGGDTNGHCDQGGRMSDCAYVDVLSDSISHDIFGVMCFKP